MFNKSTICSTANRLRKDGYTLSQAFKMAWKLAKGTACVSVAGVSKGNRQKAIEHLKHYAAESVAVILTRESTNTHDNHAIAVYISVNGSQGFKMGYLKAAVAKLLSGVMDNITTVKASLKSIVGGYYDDMLSGLRLSLSI